MGDFFAGSVNSHRRTKSTTSRSSTYTQTTSTGDSSLMKFSQRSNSTASAATTVDDDASFFTRSPKRKLLKRGVSPAGSGSENEKGKGRSLSRSLSRAGSRSRSTSRDRYSDYSDGEAEYDPPGFEARNRNVSDYELAKQLELARRNSKNQSERAVPASLEKPLPEPTIYEGSLLSGFDWICGVLMSSNIEDRSNPPTRPASRASRDSNSQCTINANNVESPPRHSRSLSRTSTERHPRGPRTPSPLPPKSPRMMPTIPLVLEDKASLMASSLPELSHVRATPRYTGIPRSKRQPFFPTGNTGASSQPAGSTTPGPSTIEPLSIRKKTSVHAVATAPSSPTPRKHTVRTSPLSRTTARIASPRRVSPQVRSMKSASLSSSSSTGMDDLEQALHLSKTTKADVSIVLFCFHSLHSLILDRSNLLTVPSSE